MKNAYVSPEIELKNESNDIVVTSAEVETGRIPFAIPSISTFSELDVRTDSYNPDSYNH